MDRNRRVVSALIMSLALCMVSPFAGAEQQTALSNERLAELQRLENDPQIKRAGEAWNKANAEATRQHLRALAASGEARDLLAASMLWAGVGAMQDETATLPAKPAQETRAWFDAARRARPRDVLVAWMEASECAGLSDSCNSRDALQYLLQAEPDNAAVQLLALAAAEKQADKKAMDAHWQAAALASTYDPHTLETGQLLYSAMQGISQPPLDPRLADAMGLALALDRPATPQDVADVGAIAMWAALALPAFTPITRQCKPEQLASASVTRQAECERILTLLAEDQSTVIAPMIGLPWLVRLNGDTTEGMAWRERLRELYWVYENALQRMPVFGQGSALPNEYSAWMMMEGELPAMRRLLERSDLPATPPAGWLPRDARYRALVSTGREPES